MAKKTTLDWIAFILLIVCGINTGIAGLFNFDVIGAIFGGVPVLMTIVAVLFGLSGLYVLYFLTKK